MADEQPVELSKRYRDPITGYGGVATARTEFAYDTPSVRLTRANDKGRPEDEWFSEARVQPVKDPAPTFRGEPLGFGMSDECRPED